MIGMSPKRDCRPKRDNVEVPLSCSKVRSFWLIASAAVPGGRSRARDGAGRLAEHANGCAVALVLSWPAGISINNRPPTGFFPTQLTREK